MRTPRAKREAILDEFDRSGMSGAEFAQYLGIKYQTFATWVQKRRTQKGGGLVVGKGAVSWPKLGRATLNRARRGKTVMWKASMPKCGWNCWIANSFLFQCARSQCCHRHLRL